MGLNFEEYKSDPKLEVEGVWCEIDDGAKVKVAFFGNANFTKLNQKLSKPYVGFRSVPEEKVDEITITLLVETILLDWENIVDKDKKPIPYSKEKARELLTASRWFRDRISALAVQEQRFRQESKDGVVKN
jgi:hypothetical protein